MTSLIFVLIFSWVLFYPKTIPQKTCSGLSEMFLESMLDLGSIVGSI